MTSSQKKYLRIFEKFEHGQIYSLFRGVFGYCKALSVRAEYRGDMTGGTIANTVLCYNAQSGICCDSLTTLRWHRAAFPPI